jgi:hypothetical protein
MSSRSTHTGLATVTYRSMGPKYSVGSSSTCWAKTVVLAVILQCPVENNDPNGLNIHYYLQARGMDAVDIDNVQCMVSRVWAKVLKQLAVIDCSGRLACVQWDGDED